MKIYNYNRITGEFISKSVANIDPMETEIQGKNVYLIPANATALKPPTTTENEVAIFNGKKWKIEADFRGQTVFNKETQQQETVSEIGEINNKFTTLKPANEYQIWSEKQNNWIIDKNKRDDLIQIISNKINAETEHNIIYGFVFSGVPIRLNRDDQFNFSQDFLIKDKHTYPHTIKALNGFYELKNAKEYQNMYMAGLQHKDNLLRAGWTKKEALKKLTTKELIQKLT